MKYYIFSFLLLLAAQTAIAQPDWQDHLPAGTDRTNFHTIQDAYLTYWKTTGCAREKHTEWKQFHRWADFWSPRINPDGTFPNPQIVVEESTRHQATRAVSDRNIAQWQSLGPWEATQGHGRIQCLAFHPTDSNLIFAGAPNGGLWKSTDGGQHWTTNTDQLPSLGVSDIAIQPDNPQVMYLGTGDKDLWIALSVGLLKSTDGGNTWQPTGLVFSHGNNRTVSRVLIDPSDPQILLVATSTSIYRSTDGGATFAETFSGLELKDMEFCLSDPNVLIAGAQNGRIFRSADNGQTWLDITANMPFPDPTKAERATIAVTPLHPDWVYIMSQGEPSNNITGGIYRSKDKGLTFEKMADNTLPTPLNWYGYTLDISPTVDGQIYCGGGFLFKSDDHGATWAEVHQASGNTGNGTFIHVDMHDIRYRPNNDVWIACDGGVYWSENADNFWHVANGGLEISELYGFGSSQSNPDFVVIGQQDCGAGSLQNGTYNIRFGGDGMECLVSPTNQNTFYLSTQLGYIDKTTNGGQNFVNFISTPVTGEGGAWTTPFVLHPTDNNIAWAGYENAWKTTNGGSNWTKLGSLPNNITIKYIRIAPSDHQTIYIIKEWGNGFFKTSDNGASWAEITPPFAGVGDVTISDQNPQHIWVTALSGYIAGHKVYHSTDGGGTWENISTGLPNLIPRTLVYQLGSPDRVFVGTELGVYYRDEDTPTWTLLGEGMPNTDIRKLEILPSINKIRAGTYGRGLWECSLDDISVKTNEALGQSKMIRLFPNPAGGSITVEKSTASPALLRFRDALGQVVLEKTMSNKSIQVSLEGLRSGIYFVSIREGDHTWEAGRFIKE